MTQIPNFGTFEQDQLKQILTNYKLTPATLAHKVSRGSWIAAPHLQKISLRIALGIAKGNARIILSMPPRHGKSEFVSVWTSVWCLEYFRKVNIILAAYGAELAEGFSRRVRRIIQDSDNHDLLDVRIGDMARSEEFNTNFGGYMYAVGLGGAITGRGANVLLIDDYIKEIKEALSPTTRDYVWNWFVTTALTRLEPNGSCIIIATRWHSDDLIGRILKQEGDLWEYIELPAIAEGPDMLGRSPGTPLFPERYDLDALAGIKRTMGSIFWEALYQQRPVDDTMRFTNVKWLKAWPEGVPVPRNMKYARVWDLAATEGGGDYLVGTLCAYDPVETRFFVLAIDRSQLGPGEIEQRVATIAYGDGPDVDIGIEQEPGSAGKILVEHFTNNILRDYRVKAIPVSKAKLVRAQPFLAAAEAGEVYYIQGQPWLQDFFNEFESFPPSNNSIHDDMIDTTAEAYTMLTGKRSLSAVWGRDTITGNRPRLKRINEEHRRAASFSIGGKADKVGRVMGATWGRRD